MSDCQQFKLNQGIKKPEEVMLLATCSRWDFMTYSNKG